MHVLIITNSCEMQRQQVSNQTSLRPFFTDDSSERLISINLAEALAYPQRFWHCKIRPHSIRI
jgi:hypothetical protein